MKKLIYGVLFFSVTSIGIIGCKKKDISNQINSFNVKETNLNHQKSTINRFKPKNYADIGTIYGSEHNKVLEYVLIENPATTLEELFPRFKTFYNSSSLNNHWSDYNPSLILSDLNSYMFDKLKFIEKLNQINSDFSNLSNITSKEKNKFNQVIFASINFINNGNTTNFVNSLRSIEEQCLIEKSNVNLVSPNQEYVRVLSIIGIALHSVEYCIEKGKLAGNNDVPFDPNAPAGIAPWVLADLGGAAVGAILNAGNYAVSGGDHSWSGFCFDVVSGGLLASGGGWISKWLW